MDQAPLRTGWIKAWVGFGGIIFACVTILPIWALMYAADDVQRYDQCVAGSRRDCERSIVWNIVDLGRQLEAEDGNISLTGISSYQVNSNSDVTPPSRSSESAPLIEKVEPRGMTNANGTYRAAAGAEVILVATIKGSVYQVEAYTIIAGKISAKPVAVFKKQKDGRWQTAWIVPPGLVGELEIRATGDDPKDRASLYLLVAAN